MFIYLLSGRHLCCYSPCIEQVIRTCEEIRKRGFHSIRMFEVRHRPFDGRSINFDNLDIGRELSLNTTSNSSSSSSCSSSNNNINGISNSEVEENINNTAIECSNNEDNDIEDTNDNDDDGKNDDNVPTKRIRQDPNINQQNAQSEEPLSQDNNNNNSNNSNNNNNNNNNKGMSNKRNFVGRLIPPTAVHVARPISSMQGHTAFLTFAVAPSNFYTPTDINTKSSSL